MSKFYRVLIEGAVRVKADCEEDAAKAVREKCRLTHEIEVICMGEDDDQED